MPGDGAGRRNAGMRTGMHLATLIPAFKPQYLPELLSALRVQTRPSERIVFADDSPGGHYGEMLMSPALADLRQGLPIELHEGARAGSAWANVMRLLDLWGGESEYVHLLFDDDIVYPRFYERHLAAHATARLSCSVSARWSATEKGLPVGDLPVPAAVDRHPARILALDQGVVFATTAADCRNWLGEFSNAVFHRDTMSVLREPRLGDVSFGGLWDLGAFMAASLLAPIGYLQDYLGYFRTGGQSNSSDRAGPYVKGAHVGYAALALGGQRIGRYTDEQARHVYATLAAALRQRFGDQADMIGFACLLDAMATGEPEAPSRFLAAWGAFQARHRF
jgi:hypothetical protein